MNTDKIILEIQQGDDVYNNLRQRLLERAPAQETGGRKHKWLSQKNLHDLESFKLLKRFQESRKRIDHLKERLQDLGDVRLSGVTYTSEPGHQSSEISDVTGNMAIRIATLKDQLEDEVSRWLDMFLEIYNILEQLERKYRLVMTSRYLIGRTWDDVAEDSGYDSTKNCILLHNQALLLMNDILTASNTAQTSQNGSEQP